MDLENWEGNWPVGVSGIAKAIEAVRLQAQLAQTARQAEATAAEAQATYERVLASYPEAWQEIQTMDPLERAERELEAGYEFVARLLAEAERAEPERKARLLSMINAANDHIEALIANLEGGSSDA